MFRYALYNVVLSLAAPLAYVYLRMSRGHRALLERFGAGEGYAGEMPVWVHACSVGEVSAVRGLLHGWREQYPQIPLVLSVATLSGLKLARQLFPEFTVMLAPFDLKGAVRLFLKRVRPRLLVLVETEVWPNLVRETRRSGVEVVIINGRISPLKYPRYKKYQRLMPPVFSYLSHVGVQSQGYAERFESLGVPASRISITGNMKYDSVDTEVDLSRNAMIRGENGFSKQDRIIIFGSTRPGDEVLAARCWQYLREKHAGLRLIVAPRHLQRLDEALQPFAGEAIIRRTEILSGRRNWHARVYILDTLGELAGFYGASDVAVIGGSFFPGVEGHNPLEPAALGIPTVFGSHMGNFPDAAALLLGAEGAVRVEMPEDLPGVLDALLNEPMRLDRIAGRGRKAILNGRGAVRRNMDLMLRHVQDS